MSMQNKGQIAAQVGDTPQQDIVNPFQLHFSADFRLWLAQQGMSLALTTYEGGKLILLGPGLEGGTVVTERNFERCMALHVEDNKNIWVSTQHHVWQLENGVDEGKQINGWDRIYLPRKSYVTGGVDVHDLAIDKDERLLGVITQYNCIAEIGGTKGSFSPYWRPPFISAILSEDRCHLNGFCLDEKKRPAYVSIVGQSDVFDGWREHKQNGGIIMNLQTNDIVAHGLSMPHTPRIYDGKLWFLEAGRGWLCRLDTKSGKVEKLLWRPGFLRGLRFHGKYAFLCSSAPRDTTFGNLPLQDELAKRNVQPQCSLDVIDLEKMEVAHSLVITGFVKELYDVALLPACRQPLLYGIHGEDVRKIVVLGPDTSGNGPLKKRKK